MKKCITDSRLRRSESFLHFLISLSGAECASPLSTSSSFQSVIHEMVKHSRLRRSEARNTKKQIRDCAFGAQKVFYPLPRLLLSSETGAVFNRIHRPPPLRAPRARAFIYFFARSSSQRQVTHLFSVHSPAVLPGPERAGLLYSCSPFPFASAEGAPFFLEFLARYLVEHRGREF